MINLSELSDNRILRRDLAPADDVAEAVELEAEQPQASGSRSGYGLASILGNDDRTAQPDTERSPWRYVCALLQSDNQRFIGTAWLAGPQLLITAGHCLYNPSRNFYPDSIDVIPARAPGLEPFGSIRVRANRFELHPEWRNSSANDRDAGAIRLDQPIPGLSGWFGVVDAEASELRDQSLTISGYPGSALGTANGHQQYAHASKSITLEERTLKYEIDTSAGQSGGPAFIYDKSLVHPLAIGIHSYGTPAAIRGWAADGNSNSGIRIDADLMAHIRQWQNGLA